LIKNFFTNNLTLLIILSAIWGSAFIAIKISVEFVNPISIASLRLIIASLFLLIIFFYKKYAFNINLKIVIFIILIGIIGNIVPFFLINWSEQFIQSNTTALLLSVAPIFTLILAPFLTKDDHFSLLKFISIIIGLVGVFFIIGFDSISNLNDSESNLIPKFAVIIAAMGYVVSSILAYNLKNIDTMTLTTLVITAAAIFSIPFMIYAEIDYPSSFNGTSLLTIIYLGLFPTAIAFQLRFHIISKAGPIFLSYVAYLIPAFGILWGYIFLKEKITLSIALGVILILIGVFISQKKKNYLM
tara:strand:+ start:86 stop:985 length:900 start_codon:yes stop_codon:yes gene_type:complete